MLKTRTNPNNLADMYLGDGRTSNSQLLAIPSASRRLVRCLTSGSAELRPSFILTLSVELFGYTNLRENNFYID